MPVALYIKWIDTPFFEICLGPAALHALQVHVPEGERSPEVIVSIWSPHLSSRISFSLVTTCESTYSSHPGYAERNMQSGFQSR